jgi:8-oxo-dGTP pyrophosphatase MutT (NUDIX family)
METRKVITAFLFREGKVLVLRRSSSVGSYQGRWAAVSGYLESDTALEQAFIELAEETGLSREDVTFLAAGEPLKVSDKSLGVRWVVHPFLFRLEKPEKIRLDREHTECCWVNPQELRRLETVPMLFETLARVLPV